MVVYYITNERLPNGDPWIHGTNNPYDTKPLRVVHMGDKYANPIRKDMEPGVEAFVSVSPQGDVTHYQRDGRTGLLKLVRQYKFTKNGMAVKFKTSIDGIRAAKEISDELLSDRPNPIKIDAILAGVDVNALYNLKTKHNKYFIKNICPLSGEKCTLNNPDQTFEDGRKLKDTIVSPNISMCAMGKFKSKNFNPSTDIATLRKPEGEYLDYPPCETMREFRKRKLSLKPKRKVIKKPIKKIKRCICKKKK